MFKKRKKNRRQRGSKTHGWGSMKKHRGAGNRGGRGKAGTGKRGDAKKPSYWKTPYFGKFGFKPKRKKTINVINISYLEEKFKKLLDKKVIEEQKGVYAVDLGKIKIGKLLSAGNPTRKYRIKVKLASRKAVEKIKKADGEVLLEDKKLEEKVIKDMKKG